MRCQLTARAQLLAGRTSAALPHRPHIEAALRAARRRHRSALAGSASCRASLDQSSEGEQRRDGARLWHPQLVTLAVGCASVLTLQQPAQAEVLQTAYFAGGNFSFLEKQFLDLKYAGVKDVVPGFADADHIETVKVCAGCHVQFHPTGVYVGHDGMERGEVLIRQLTVVL